MGAIVAAVNKKGRNVDEIIVAMLKELQHRGKSAHGIVSSTQLFCTETFKELENITLDAPVAIGYNLSRTSQYCKQSILANGFAFAFDGKIYISHGASELQTIKETLRKPEDAQKLIQELDGDFAFALTNGERIMAGRSALGVYPLYYGENTQIAAIASEQKALWRIGLKDTMSFPPGNMAIVSHQGFHFHEIKTLNFPKTRETQMGSVVKNLSKFLVESIEKRLLDVKEAAVAFSGGLDSSLVAFLTKKCGTEPTLIWAGLKNCKELEHAKKAAEALNLPLETYIRREEDIKEVLPKVLWLIEDSDPVKASIAIPFYWTAEKASALGLKVLLAGQGSDELFGGYKRYLDTYSSQGLKELKIELFNDVVKAYKLNYERDSKTCSFHGVELRLPFADYKLSKYAVSIAAGLKVKSAQDSLRKQVLRETAKNLGLPKFIAERPKKAIQYATGVNKALKKLARMEGLSIKDYVEKLFKQVCVKPYA